MRWAWLLMAVVLTACGSSSGQVATKASTTSQPPAARATTVPAAEQSRLVPVAVVLHRLGVTCQPPVRGEPDSVSVHEPRVGTVGVTPAETMNCEKADLDVAVIRFSSTTIADDFVDTAVENGVSSGCDVAGKATVVQSGAIVIVSTGSASIHNAIGSSDQIAAIVRLHAQLAPPLHGRIVRIAPRC